MKFRSFLHLRGSYAPGTTALAVLPDESVRGRCRPGGTFIVLRGGVCADGAEWRAAATVRVRQRGWAITTTALDSSSRNARILG